MDSQNSNNVTHTNQGYNTNSALKTRLDTKQLLFDLKLSLSGELLENYDKEDGTLGTKISQVGEPRANRKGVQGIMSYVQNYINNQVVQGNYIDEELFYLEVDQMEDSLRNMLIINAPAWEVHDHEIIPLYSQIRALITNFLTRLIFNKERESYGDTIKTIESNTLQQSKGNLLFN